MKEFSIKDLARIIKAEPAKDTSGIIAGVSTDSRTTKAGDCFFSIPGENFDGHDYVSGAFTKGAHCAIVSKDLYSKEFPDEFLRLRTQSKLLVILPENTAGKRISKLLR
jgi:UDP-N-acetylmuramoyl-tripeptide--D-alanyl-D-alanine ligase